jgi:hypothetical protein
MQQVPLFEAAFTTEPRCQKEPPPKIGFLYNLSTRTQMFDSAVLTPPKVSIYIYLYKQQYSPQQCYQASSDDHCSPLWMSFTCPNGSCVITLRACICFKMLNILIIGESHTHVKCTKPPPPTTYDIFQSTHPFRINQSILTQTTQTTISVLNATLGNWWIIYLKT